jgi:hypothetical protein
MNLTTQIAELDPETGLALLPEGYIWRVEASNRYLELRLVQITTKTLSRPKWLFFGSEEYTETTESILMEDFFDTHNLLHSTRTKENIAYHLAQLSKKIFKKWQEEQAKWDLMRSFRGDYPPKKLS